MEFSKQQLFFLSFLIVATNAREFELESFKPSPNTDFDLIDYGTIRVAKVKKSQFTILGDFVLKRNVGNDQTVKDSRSI